MNDSRERGAAGAQGASEKARRPTRGSAAWFWIGVAALVLWLVLMADAHAQVFELRADKAACVNFSCRRISDRGTAVSIGRYNRGKELFLTSREVIDGGRLLGLWLRANGKWTPAYVVEQSGRLALIGANLEPIAAAAQISGRSPTVGENVAIAGFPEKEQRIQQGEITRVFRGGFEVDRQIDMGERGGGVFGTDGRVFGILLNNSQGGVIVEPAASIREFLSGSYRKMPQADPPPRKPAENDDAGRLDPMEQLRQRIEQLEREKSNLQSRVFDLELAGRGNKTSPEQPAATPGDIDKLFARIERFEVTYWNQAQAVADNLNGFDRRVQQFEQFTRNQTSINGTFSRALADNSAESGKRLGALEGEIEKLTAAAEHDNQWLAKLQERISALEFFKNNHKLRVELLDDQGNIVEFDEVLFSEPIQLQFAPISNQANTKSGGNNPTQPANLRGGLGVFPRWAYESQGDDDLY